MRKRVGRLLVKLGCRLLGVPWQRKLLDAWPPRGPRVSIYYPAWEDVDAATLYGMDLHLAIGRGDPYRLPAGWGVRPGR